MLPTTPLFEVVAKILRYLLAGGTATAVQLGLLVGGVEFLGLPYLLASGGAFVAAFLVSFILQKFWTFQDKNLGQWQRQMIFYLIVALTNLGINVGLMYVLVEMAKWHYFVAQLFVLAVISLESFGLYNFFIFNKSPKNSVLILTGIYPPSIGGPATVVRHLAHSLMQQGWKVRVVTYSISPKSIQFSDPWPVRRISLGLPPLLRKALYALAVLDQGRKAQVIYAFDTYTSGWCAWLYKMITGKKYLVRFVGDSAWESAFEAGKIQDDLPTFIATKYSPAIERAKARRAKILTQADEVVVPSQFLRRIAEQIGVSPQRIKVIYNSVEWQGPPYAQEAQKIRGESQASHLLLTICRLTAWKGVDGLIMVLPKLLKDFPNLKLMVVGEGSQKGKLQDLARQLKVEEAVVWVGRVAQNQIVNFLQAADIFILNSFYEGLSHTLLEAMSLGKPIIASRAGGNPELINDRQEGILVSYNNTQEIYAAIMELLKNPALAQKLAANAKAKSKLFRWSNTFGATLEVLKEVI